MVLELLQNSPAVQVPPALSLSDDPAQTVQIKSLPVRQKSDVQSYRAGDKVIFNIPSDFVDFRESYVAMYAQIDAAGAGSTYDRFSMPFGSIIERARVYMGSKLLEDIDNYSVLRAIFRNAKPSAITNNTTEGVTTAATRAAESVAGRMYYFKLEMQSLEQVIPLHKTAQPLRIELTLSQVDACLESDGTNPTYIVNNAYYHYRTLDVVDSYDALLDAKIASGSFIIPIRTWANFDWSQLSGASAQIEIPSKFKSCNRVYSVMRTLADTTDLAVDDKFTTFNPNDIDLLALKVNQKIYPSDKYELSLDNNKFELLEVFIDTTENRFHGRFRFGDILGAGNWATNTLVMPFDLRDDASVDEDLYGNGIDTASSGSSMVLQITLGSAPAATQTVNVYTEYEAAVKFYSSGKLDIMY